MTPSTSCVATMTNDTMGNDNLETSVLYHGTGIVGNETIVGQILLTQRVESCLSEAVNQYTSPEDCGTKTRSATRTNHKRP